MSRVVHSPVNTRTETKKSPENAAKTDEKSRKKTNLTLFSQEGARREKESKRKAKEERVRKKRKGELREN